MLPKLVIWPQNLRGFEEGRIYVEWGERNSMRKKQRNGNRLSYTTSGKFEQNYVVGSLFQQELGYKKEVEYI